MTPTNELRWLERTHRQPYEDYWNVRLDAAGNQVTERVWTTHTLQQKWEEVRNFDVNWLTPPAYEWRDVPQVKEFATNLD